MKKLFVLLLLSAAGLSLKAQSVDFKFKLPLNKPMHSVKEYIITTDADQVVNVTLQIKSDMTATKFAQKVYSAETNVKAVKMSMDAGIMSGSYDSENPTDDMIAEALAPEVQKLIDKKVVQEITEKGKVTNINEEDGKQKDITAITEYEFYINLPDKALKPGESWPIESTKGDQTLKATMKYIGKTVEGYQMDLQGEMADENGETAGTINGTYFLDLKAHYPIKTTLIFNFNTEDSKATVTINETVTL